MIVSDHSRIATKEHCPRERYWCYEYEGRGLERNTLNLDAEVGSACHAVAQDVLEAAKAHGDIQGVLARSLAANVREFREKVQHRGLSLELAAGYEQDEEGNIAAQEGQLGMLLDVYTSWVVQIMVAWVNHRLPALLMEYEVVEVEKEEVLLMAGGELLFLARYDALLRRHTDGELFVLNFKTVGEANQWWQEQWPLDMQTLSEVLPVEARLGQRVSGVLIEGLVKGGKRLQYPPNSGRWWINSPLIWMWKKGGAAPFPAEYAARYEWSDDTGNHRLGKGWSKQPAWEDELGLEGWMQWLEEHEQELVTMQFVQLPPILRSDQACARWVAQTEETELGIAASAKYVQLGAMTVDAAFPMHTSSGNCIKFRGGNVETGSNSGKCNCYELCHGIAAMDPLANGYKWRDANHPKEAEVRWGAATIQQNQSTPEQIAAGEEATGVQ
jgi:hypothetical protein